MSRTQVVKQQATALVREVKRGAVVLGSASVLLLGIELVDLVVFAGGLDGFGIRPRSAAGLMGILFAPLLHGSLGHLGLNLVSLWTLGPLVMLRRRMDFWVVGVTGALSSGLGAWLVGGAQTVHVGLSGVLFAFLGFLMGRGFFERRPGAVVLSVLVTWLFGGLLWGAIPLTAAAGVSWEAHLFGFFGGLATAKLLGSKIRKS